MNRLRAWDPEADAVQRFDVVRCARPASDPAPGLDPL